MKKIQLLILGIFLIGMLPISMAAPEFASIKVSLLSQDPDPALPGSLVDVRLKVENLGREDLDSATFEIIPDSPFELKSGDNGRREPGTLYGGQIGDEAYAMLYTLRVAEDAVEGDYDVNLRYTSDNGENWNRLGPFTLSVDTRDPILSITSVSTSPEVVGLGQEVDLLISLENIADSYIRNVRVNLQLFSGTTVNGVTQITEVPFAPIESSNEKIIKLLNAGDKKLVSFKLKTDSSATPKIYKFPIILTYEDDVGTELSREGIVSIQVGQEPDPLVTLDNTDPFIADRTSMLDVRFTNKGLVDMKLLTVTLGESDSYELMSSNIVYVGNIDSDDYENAEFNIKVKNGIELVTFPLTVEYYDPNNEKYSKTYELTHKVYSQEKAIEQGLEKKSSTPGYLVIVAVIIVAFVLYRIFRKKKR